MINVLNSGFYSTIQDFGRIGFQQYGVPYSGVMDRQSAALANALLGNDKNEAIIEMTMTGITLQFNIETYVVISGANMSPKLNDSVISRNKIIKVSPNGILSFGKLISGFRCYLAVLGGFNTEKVMGSKSMYQYITKQQLLYKNDVLLINRTSPVNLNKHAAIKIDESYISSEMITVFKGPDYDLLSKHQQKELFSKLFTISKDNNRMAYQLLETLENKLESIMTSPVLPGTVQLTPSGKLIVLMRDCQTTGGYPRILQLKASSINALAQKNTKQKVKFYIKN